MVVATGRPVETGRMVVKDLGLTIPGCYMIAFNGAVLYDCSADRILYEKTIPVQYVYQLFDKAHRAGLYIPKGQYSRYWLQEKKVLIFPSVQPALFAWKSSKIFLLFKFIIKTL